jgi:hypothetical protein
MVGRVVIVAVVIAAALLWLWPVALPNWVVAAFVLGVIFPMAVGVGVKRFRQERRLARTFWQIVTRR